MVHCLELRLATRGLLLDSVYIINHSIWLPTWREVSARDRHFYADDMQPFFLLMFHGYSYHPFLNYWERRGGLPGNWNPRIFSRLRSLIQVKKRKQSPDIFGDTFGWSRTLLSGYQPRTNLSWPTQTNSILRSPLIGSWRWLCTVAFAANCRQNVVWESMHLHVYRLP